MPEVIFTGGYYDRTLEQTVIRLLASPSPRAAFGVNVEVNRLRGGVPSTVTTRLIAPEVRPAWNPRVPLTAFYQ